MKLSQNSGSIEFRGTLCIGLWKCTLTPARSQMEREQEVPSPPLEERVEVRGICCTILPTTFGVLRHSQIPVSPRLGGSPESRAGRGTRHSLEHEKLL